MLEKGEEYIHYITRNSKAATERAADVSLSHR